MTVLAPLPPDDQSYELVHMLTPSRAVDLYLGDLGRRSRSKSGRTTSSYARILDKFTDQLRKRGDIDVSEITSDDCRAFLDRYQQRAAGTQANVYSILNSFLEWLDQQRRIKRNPLDFVPQPRRIAAEHLDVTSVSTADVPKLLAACRSDSERICVAILAYLGPRRNAVALLRLSDYDAERRLMRFREKGSKVIRKPVPDELAEILDAAIARGVYALVGPGVWGSDRCAGPGIPAGRPDHDPYLVPSEGGRTRQGDRDDRVIWRLVKKVGDRAGIDIHVHALRAAFAVHYLETGGDLVGLQELLGHASIETTRIYLRKLDKAKAMEPVRALSWDSGSEREEGPRHSARTAFDPAASEAPVPASARSDDFKPLALLSGSWREDTIDEPDYVYFIANADGSRIKIGYSGDPMRRLAMLQKDHFDELRLLLAIPGNRADEVALHHQFSAYRLRGEWFSASDELLEYIAKKSNATGSTGDQFAGKAYASSVVLGAGGFEPPFVVKSDEHRAVTEPRRLASPEAAE